MATNWPASLDAYTRPASTDAMDAAGVQGDVVIDNLYDAVEAIEYQMGVGPALGSQDYLYNAWQAPIGSIWISAANRSLATPFWVPDTDNFDALALEVTTAAASATVRVHRYALAAGGEPGAKNIDQLVASVDVATTGIKICTFAASTSFTRGWHYIVLENVAGAARYRTGAPVHGRFHPGGNFTSSGTNGLRGAYQTTAVLADPWTGDTTPIRDCLSVALRKT